jgi:DNA-binding MarR family transcriptional regulator
MQHYFSNAVRTALPTMKIIEAPIEAIPETCLCMASRVAARMSTKVLGTLLAPLGLDATQFPVLVMLHLHSGIAVSALSKRLDIESSAISRNIQVLERKGLVISLGGHGRHGKRLVLSPYGHELLDQAVRRWRDAQEMLIAELGEAEVNEMRRKMKSLSDASQRVLTKMKEME